MRVGDGPYGYSSYHSGGGNYEWLTVTKTVSAAATLLHAEMYIDSGVSISADVELICLMVGSSCDYWTPYVSRNRMTPISNINTTGTSSTPQSITGAGFSPVAIWGSEIYAASSPTSLGGAKLDGATITHNCAWNGGSGVTGYLYYNTNRNAIVTSFDSDGVTLSLTHSSGAIIYGAFFLLGGTPI